jgi:copper oxidase (laccase) domain-containing protein
MILDDFKKTEASLRRCGAIFTNEPEVTQTGSIREQMLMTVSDGCGNAIEFKGLHKITDVHVVTDEEKSGFFSQRRRDRTAGDIKKCDRYDPGSQSQTGQGEPDHWRAL